MNTNYAGFWLRFVAAIIDGIIIGTVLTIVALVIFIPLGFGIASSAANGSFENEDPSAVMGLVGAVFGAVFFYIFIAYVLQTLYHSLLESSKYQGSFGKLALGIIVTDEAGQKINFSKALVRNLGKILSHAVFYIGYIMAGFTEKKQGLHDMIAKTLVVIKPRN